MSFLKNLCLYTCIILLILSLYNDLTKSFVHQTHTNTEENGVQMNETNVVQIKLSAGDTFISVAERLYGKEFVWKNVDKVIKDFADVNPNIDPFHLDYNTYYYFPVYK